MGRTGRRHNLSPQVIFNVLLFEVRINQQDEGNRICNCVVILAASRVSQEAEPCKGGTV